MNLGVETPAADGRGVLDLRFQHSLMNLGVETPRYKCLAKVVIKFQHSLMNLGVETHPYQNYKTQPGHISAFSDESWGGDPPYTAGGIWFGTAYFSIL